MNQLSNAVKTMSSREIAELTGKNHADVLRDVRKMLIELEVDESRFAGVYLGGNGEQRKLFNLDREHTDCLLTGYSVKARLMVIKRWHELENQQTVFNIPTTLSGALLLAAHQAELIEQQQERLAIAAPKEQHFDRYVARDGLRNLTDVAKGMDISAVKLGRLLRDHGMAFKRTDKLVWMQWFVDKRLWHHKAGSGERQRP